MEKFLKKLAKETIDKCTLIKKTSYFGVESEDALLLPSGDEKYYSFWVRDCAMMAESGLVSEELLERYIKIIATHGQNGKDTLYLENGLTVPPYTIADHINYDGKPVYFPGTYESGKNQGIGEFGFYPSFCDNYYYTLMVAAYIKQTGSKKILSEKCGALTIGESVKYAFEGYNIDSESDLCVSDNDKYTVDWGFTDSIKKSGKLLMASLLRYNSAVALQKMFDDSEYYSAKAEKIKKSIVSTFYDDKTGWMYSATETGKQFDVWATAYAVFSGITSEQKTLNALYDAYINKTAVVDGYVRHILTYDDFSDKTAWEFSYYPYQTYQNGGYWATPTGWYAYALYLYNGNCDILNDFIKHTEKYKNLGAPFEWINESTTEYEGLNYGTSGVLPYIGALKIAKKV